MSKPKTSTSKGYFTRATFGFLRELKANNNRDWFLENKDRFEATVRDPFLRFIADFSGKLEKINPHFVGAGAMTLSPSSLPVIHRITRQYCLIWPLWTGIQVGCRLSILPILST